MAYDAGDIEAKLTLDKDPFDEGIEEAKRQADELDDRRIEVTLLLDDEHFKEQVDAAKEKLDELGRKDVHPKVTLDGEDAVFAGLVRINDYLDEIGAKNARPHVEVDGLTEARLDLMAFNNELNRISRRTVTARVRVTGVDEALAKLALLETILDRIDGRTVTVHVNTDEVRRGTDDVDKMGSELQRTGENADEYREKVREAGNSTREAGNEADGARGHFRGLHDEMENGHFIVDHLGESHSHLAKDMEESGRAAGVLGTIWDSLTSIGQGLSNGFSSMGNGISSVTSKVGEMGASMDSVAAGPAAALLQANYSLATSTLYYGGIAGLVTYAVGALGAAFSALPGVIGAGAAAFAVFKLGMDGITNAYKQELKPALDALGKQVSSVFQAGLVPVFHQLATVLIPAITENMKNLAQAFVNTASAIQQVITRQDNLANIRSIIDQTAVAVNTLNPEIARFVDMLIRVGAQSGAIGIVVGMVQDLLRHTTDWFNKMQDMGMITKSLQNLRDILDTIEQTIFHVLTAAMQFFNDSTAGAKTLMQGISDLADKIGNSGLGKAFGDAMAAAGRLLSAIPQSVWDTIAQAVSYLSGVLTNLANDPSFPEFVQAVANGIGMMINLFGELIATVRMVVDALKLVFNGLSAVWDAFFGSDGSVQRDSEIAKTNWNNMLSAGSDLGKGLTQVFPSIGDSVNGMAQNTSQAAGSVQQSTGQMNSAFGSVGPAAQSAADQHATAATRIASNNGLIPASAVLAGQGIAPPIVQGSQQAAQGSQAATSQINFQPILDAANQVGGQLPGILRKAFTDAATAMNQQLDAMKRSAQDAFQQMNQTANQQMAAMQRSITTNMQGSARIMNTQLTTMSRQATQQFTAISRTANQQMTAVQRTIQTQITSAARVMNTNLTAMQRQTQTSFTNMQRQVQTSSTQMVTQIRNMVTQATAQFRNLTTQANNVGTTFTRLRQTVVTAMTQMRTAVTTGMNAIRQAMQQGIDQIAQTWIRDWQQMEQQTTTSMQNIQTIVQNGMNQISQIIYQILDLIVTMWANAWDNIATIQDLYLEYLFDDIKDWGKQVTKLWQLIIKIILELWQEMWQRLEQETQQGGQKVQQAAQQVGQQIKQVFQDLADQMQEIGMQMMQRLASGIQQGGQMAIQAAATVAAGITALFPASPAKEGPLSGSGDTLITGGHITSRLAEGINNEAHAVMAAVAHIAEIAARMGIGASTGIHVMDIVQQSDNRNQGATSASGTTGNILNTSTSNLHSVSNTNNSYVTNPATQPSGMNGEQIREIVKSVAKMQPTIGSINAMLPQGASVTDIVNQVAFEFRHAKRGMYAR